MTGAVDEGLEPRRSLLLAELALQRGDVGSARLILYGEPGDLVADKLRRPDDLSARLEDAPREQVS